MVAFVKPKYSYFQIIYEIDSFIALLKGGLKVH